MNIIIYQQDDPKNFEQLWQLYTKKNQLSVEFQLELLSFKIRSINNLFKNYSFILVDSFHNPIGICFLPVEQINTKYSISVNDSYIISPHAKNEKILKQIFDIIIQIKNDLNISQIKFHLSKFINYKYNELLKYGFVNTSSTTCSIDLSQSKEQLWINLRKSYKALINSIDKDSDFSFFISADKNQEDIHSMFVKFHKNHMIEANKIPYGDIIYSGFLDCMKAGIATILGVKFRDQIIIANYFFHDTQHAIYSSSAYDTNKAFAKLPLNHYLLYKAILHFKDLNYMILNFGEPCGFNHYNGLDDYLDEKQINISHFKMGMGVALHNLFRGKLTTKQEKNNHEIY